MTRTTRNPIETGLMIQKRYHPAQRAVRRADPEAVVRANAFSQYVRPRAPESTCGLRIKAGGGFKSNNHPHEVDRETREVNARDAAMARDSNYPSWTGTASQPAAELVLTKRQDRARNRSHPEDNYSKTQL
jgi:hypothetical protein